MEEAEERLERHIDRDDGKEEKPKLNGGGSGERLFFVLVEAKERVERSAMQTVARKKSQTSMVSAAKNHGEFHIFIHVVSF